MPFKIFLCYAQEDEALLKKLRAHLKSSQRERLLDIDQDISAGNEREREINARLNAAQIILLLVSPYFMNSDYCYDIMNRSLEKHERAEAHVIPVILRPTDWQTSPLARLEAVPKNGLPVTKWRNQDEAYLNIVEGIHKSIKQRNSVLSTSLPPQSVMHNQSSSASPSPPPMSPIVTRPLTKQKLVFFFSIVMIIAICIGMISVALASRGISFIKQMAPTTTTTSKAYANPTEIALQNELIQVTGAKPDINTPLTNSAKGAGWSEGTLPTGTCIYTPEGYYVTTSPSSNSNSVCPNHWLSVKNFALQVNMKIIRGEKGGVIFRISKWKGLEVSDYYQLFIMKDGSYDLFVSKDENPRVLGQGQFTAINKGFSKINQLTIIANGSTTDLFVNGQVLDHIIDSDFQTSRGIIAFFAGPAAGEVIFSNLKVWTLSG